MSEAVETERASVRRRRCQAAVVLLACSALLGVALYVTPDPRGLGTHEQLGLGRCGMIVTTGYPCPTCGMTTAFACTVRGRLIAALLAQPTGMLLALATIAVWLAAGYVLVTGRPSPLKVPYMTPYRLFWTLLALLLGGWGFKIAYGLATGTLPMR